MRTMPRNPDARSWATRRDFLRAVVGSGCLGPLVCATTFGQDAARPVEAGAAGPGLKGVNRHPAMFWQALEEKKVLCQLCPRQCQVANVERGYCGVRENRDGKYQTLVYGTLCSANVDPIEKKPLFHYLPGTTAFSVATAGCNMECKFCQNWRISQFRPEQVDLVRFGEKFLAQLERRSADFGITIDRQAMARGIVGPLETVALCKALDSPTIAYTYSEPVVFYEYMHDAAAAGREHGIGSVMISNGYIQAAPLRELCKYLTAIKVDLKAFTEKFYRDTCSGRLQPVLDALMVLKSVGIHLELVVLIIPTLNDSPEEIRKMSKWVVANLGADVPMHFTRFHKMYRLKNLPDTPVATLETARKVALDAGVHYAYAGNVWGHPGENTYCHSCGQMLIRRLGFRVVFNRIGSAGVCPKCKRRIPGVWTQAQALGFKPAGA